MEAKLIAYYSPTDEKFSDYCILQIKNNPNARKSVKDPDKLNSIATTMSNVKKKLIASDKYRHHEYDTDLDIVEADFPDQKKAILDFNELTVSEQLKFQANAPKSDLNDALRQVHIVPQNLLNYGLDSKEAKSRMKSNEAVLKSKTNDMSTATSFTGEQMLKILEGLKSDTIKQLAPAVLLATGRRTHEILETAAFEPVPDNRYAAIFSGQAKTESKEKYEIPLLAPNEVVIKGFHELRKLIANQSYPEKVIQRACKPIKPHDYRRAYSVACEQLYNDGLSTKSTKKMSANGYISSILGHQNPKTSVHYNIVNVEKPAVYRVADIPTMDMFKHAAGAVMEKRVKELIEFMGTNKKITQTALAHTYGGAPRTWKQLLDQNDELITKYNSSI